MKKQVFELRAAGTLVLAVLASVILVTAISTTAQQPAGTNEIIPVIMLDEVRLSDAIETLAKHAGINYILDPKLSGLTQTVNGRWEKTTAEQVLSAVLTNQQLKIIQNPATSVARIVSSNQVVKPVAASRVGTATNEIVPVIVFDEVRLDDAIKRLSAQAHLQVTLDPKLPKPAALPNISVRWTNLTPRQALAALLDNYDLIMIEEASSGVGKILVKKVDH